MDWSQYNNPNYSARAEQHRQDEHDRAHESPYIEVFNMAMARFTQVFDDFTKFESDKDPHAKENFVHLFESAVGHAMNVVMAELHEQGKMSDELSTIFAAAGFGFILGRTFQEFETKRLVDEGKLYISPIMAVGSNGPTEI